MSISEAKWSLESRAKKSVRDEKDLRVPKGAKGVAGINTFTTDTPKPAKGLLTFLCWVVLGKHKEKLASLSHDSPDRTRNNK